VGTFWLAIVQPLTPKLSGDAIEDEAVTTDVETAPPEVNRAGADEPIEPEWVAVNPSEAEPAEAELVTSELAETGLAEPELAEPELAEPEPIEMGMDKADLPEQALANLAVAAVSPVSPALVSANWPEIQVGQYLDANQRYQVLECLPTAPTDTYRLVRVLDCKPLQISALDVLAMQDSLVVDNPTDEAAIAEETAIVPAIAEPYLLLPSRTGQVLPLLHDCWQTKNNAIALVEDRSDWPTLLSYWQTATPSLLELLHWFHEMVVLWDTLASWHACRSLLEPTNLRLDEDQVLCLQRLYPDLADQPPTLSQLGQLWQLLLSQSQATLIGPVLALFQDLQEEVITTPAALRSRIEAIAQEIQQPPADGEVTVADITTADTTPAARSDWYGTTIAAEPTTANLALEVTTGPLDLPDFGDLPLDPEMQAMLQDRLDRDHDIEDEEEEAATVALPMRLASLQDVGRTDVGCKRQRNEDYFSILSEQQKLETPLGHTVSARGVYVLCDGMGGHAGGEVASTLAADTLRQFFLDHWFNAADEQVRQDLPSYELIAQGIDLANQAIYQINQENASAGSGRMGTTLVLLLLQDSKVAIAHVGDSRLYRVTRKHPLEQLTIDHEVGQQEIQRGVDPDIAYAHADAYQLTQAIGPRNNDFIHPDIQFLELNEDTLLMLCSDGLSDNNLVEENWQTHLLPLLSSRANLHDGAKKLIDLANQHNGHDNITVVLVRVKLQPHLDYLNRTL